jgi:hypothetical protein
MNKVILLPKRSINSFVDNCAGSLNHEENSVTDNVPFQFLTKFMGNETIKIETEKILREVLNSRKKIKSSASLSYSPDYFPQENNAETPSETNNTKAIAPEKRIRYEQRISDTVLHSKDGLPLLMAFKSYRELNDDPNILKTGIFSRREYDISSISEKPFKGKKSSVRKLCKEKVNEGASFGSPPTSIWITVQQWFTKLLNVVGEKTTYFWDLLFETSHMKLFVQFGMLIAGVAVLYAAKLIESPNKLIKSFYSILLSYVR